MRNIRAIACIMIILGSVLVQVSYRLLSESPDEQSPAALMQHLLPALAGLVLIHGGVKGLLSPPGSSN